MGARKRDVTRIAGRRAFAAKLRRIAAALDEERSFSIQVGRLRLRVPAKAEWSVEHEREAGIEELELQFRWRSPTA